MATTRKGSTVKDALRNARVDVRVTPARHCNVYTAQVQVIAGGASADGFSWLKGEWYLEISLQANDCFSPGYLDKTYTHQLEYQRGFRHFAGLGPFYGASIEASCRVLAGDSPERTNPARVSAAIKLIRATVLKYNLHHRYPNCELPEIVAALFALGAVEGEWIVHPSQGESLSVREWNHTREKQRPAVASEGEA